MTNGRIDRFRCRLHRSLLASLSGAFGLRLDDAR